jgi:dihydroxyacetone kinase
MVMVADDVSLRASVAATGRRGLAGTVLVHKVAGAAAAAGLDLAGVRAAAQAAADAVGTMGVGLSACTVPAAGAAGFELPDGEMELGLGIHGERGVRRVPLASADAAVETMLGEILADKAFAPGSSVVLLVNGLGGTPAMELAVVARRALQVLRERGLVVARAWSGTLLSALEMAGCSLSVMAVDEARLRLLDAPAAAPAWPGGGRIPAAIQRVATVPPPAAAGSGEPTPAPVRAAVHAVCAALRAAEPELTAMDAKVGDGDLGAALARGAGAAEGALEGGGPAPAVLARIAGAVRRDVGGTSGPLYAALLLRAARTLDGTAAGAAGWTRALSAGADAVAALGGARPGDCTMLAALRPGADAFAAALAAGEAPAAAWRLAVAAAERGAAATAGMTPRLGRASYLGERALGVTDPGAEGVVVWMRALIDTAGGAS